MTVTLIRSGGDDLAIVNAARVSYAKQSMELSEADKGLINYLAKNHHGTPFEMVEFWFHVHTPIGVAREWQRHRIGSFNEVSTRYVTMPNEAYLPLFEDMRTQVGKPGHYKFEPIPHDTAEWMLNRMT
jgi:thymidylate synthase (FAD)